MQHIKITIPTNDAFRSHLMIAFLYMITYFNERHRMPHFGIEDVLNPDDLANLKDKLLNAPHNSSIKITPAELQVIYASVHLMVKLLVSEHDEMIFDNLIAELPDDIFHEQEKQNGSFTNFRNNVIQANMHIMKDTEEKFHDVPELADIKERLADIHIH